MVQRSFEANIEIIAKSKCIVEVNTRGVYTGKYEGLYPGQEVLRQMVELDIPVTISSDAHKPSDLNTYFNETEKMLKELGYKSVRVLLNREWCEQEI